MQSILIISFSALDRDPRVNRQKELFKDNYDLTLAGYSESQKSDVELISIERKKNSLPKKLYSASLLAIRCYQKYYWAQSHIRQALDSLEGRNFDLILANDISSLPLAIKLAGNGTRILFDAHEYAPLEFEDRFVWRMLFQRYYYFLCSKYLSKVDSMMTVCDGIAEEYQNNFGVNPVVVTNAPRFQNLNPKPVGKDVVKIVHHGLAHKSRNIELMIEVFKLLDERFCLDFYLVGDDEYIRYLRDLAKDIPRIQFCPPVGMKKLSEVSNQYDIGLFLLLPINFNYAMALPNKFFEFIQARLAIAIGPSVEMARLVNQYDCGVVAPDFEPSSLAKILNDLSNEKIAYFKNQSDGAAKILCFERNAEKIRKIVNQLIGN
ncbi:glycosyltransferase [Kaarinaea lacus]